MSDETQTSEPKFREVRLAFIPSECKYPTLYKLYKKHQSLRWTDGAFNTEDDKYDWEHKLNTQEKRLIKRIFAYFAGSDVIVMDNIESRMLPDIDTMESKLFYAEQMAAEAVHTISYGKLLDAYIQDKIERYELSNAISTINTVQAKADWAKRWTYGKHTLAERLIAYIIIEGLFFSGSFCVIFWLKHRGLMLNALCKSNDWISRDEGIHVEFGIEQYKVFGNEGRFEKLNQDRIYEIFREAVKIETEFICDSMECRLIGINSDSMTQYIHFIADYLLAELDCPKLYNAKNPFDFVHLQGMESKANFFEVANADYQMANAMGGENRISFDADV